MEPLLPHLALPLGGGIGGVKNQIARHRDGTLLRLLQEIQAPQQGGFAGAGGADDGQGLALLQIKLMSSSTRVAPNAFQCDVLPELP